MSTVPSAPTLTEKNPQVINAQIQKLTAAINNISTTSVIGLDSTGKRDSSSTLQASINSLGSNGGVIVIPPGTYILSGIVVPSNVTLLGNFCVTINSTSQTYVFGIAGTKVRIEGFTFDMTGSGASSSAIRFLTSINIWNNIRIYRCRFQNCVHSIDDEYSASNYSWDVVLYDLWSTFTRGTPYFSQRSRGDWFITQCVADHTHNITPVTWNGFYFTDFVGLDFDRCSVQGPTGAVQTPQYQPTAIGFYLVGIPPVPGGSASVWMRNCLADSTMGDGITILVTTFIQMVNCSCVLNLGNGISLNDVQEFQLSNIELYGPQGTFGAAANVNGLSIVNANTEFGTINGIRATQFTGSGVSISNATNITVCGVNSQFNGNWGWAESGTNLIVKVGGILTNNDINGGAGSLAQDGALSSFSALMPNSGTFSANFTGVGTLP